MTWNNIKEKAIKELADRLRNFHDPELIAFLGMEAIKRTIHTKQVVKAENLTTEFQNIVAGRVNQVDIRSYKDLLRIAPKSFPACARNGNCVIEMTDKGWEILPNNGNE